jgi:hypothetical protein
MYRVRWIDRTNDETGFCRGGMEMHSWQAECLQGDLFRLCWPRYRYEIEPVRRSLLTRVKQTLARLLSR